jgi:predicted ATPase/class 3 adenylate cyclase
VQTSIRFGNVELRPAERQLLLDGAPAHVGGRAFDVLVALIERRDRVVTKDELFALVWPGLVVEENNLQVHISALRKLLGAQAIVTMPGRGYRFALPVHDDAERAAPVTLPAGAVTHLFTDVEGSARLWEEQPQAMAAAMARHDALCRQLIAAHRGQLIKQTGDGVHAAFEQAADAIGAAVALQLGLQDAALDALLRVRIGMNRGADELRAGDYYGPAVNRAARVMAAAHGGQVLLTQAVVDGAQGALPNGIALRDLGALRLRDLAGPEQMYQVLHAGLRAEFPALRSLEATPNNLPQQLNSFIGRERELTEVAELLAQHRLITLLAMGGIGKSRLAVQLGAQLLDRYPDGVWLVELAALTDPQSVPQALATVLGLRDEPGTSLIDTLINHLRERQLLILLDNCEHLVDACAQLAKTLLQRTTGVRVLATSRDPLAIAGEMSVPLQPLSVPGAGQAPVEALLQHDAIRLFVDRARATQPAFSLDARTAHAVVEICTRLDGIPLALELAAARVRVMTPDVIAGRLDQRFKLLVAGDRTVLPRQKTLRALIDWSYDLLDAREARLFERLSVFTAGWTLEAAEQVCGFGELERADVLDLLGGLVQKSLVLLDAHSGRYRMLETVREFGRERLQSGADADAVLQRHLDWCVALAETAFPKLTGPDATQWLMRLDTEHENILSALRWASPQGALVDRAQRLLYRMRLYWIVKGLLGVAVRSAENLLLNPALSQFPDTHCAALSGAGQLLFFAGQHRQARQRLVAALAVAREHGFALRYRQSLQPLSMACLGEGDLAAASPYIEEGLALAEAADDRRELAGAVNTKAMLLRMEGRLPEAREQCQRVLELLDDSDMETIAIARLNLSMVLIGLGVLDEADTLLQQVVSATRELGTVTLSKSVLEVCCGRAVHVQHDELAATLYGAAAAIGEKSGLTRDAADDAFLRPLVEQARARLGQERFFSLASAGRQCSVEQLLDRIEAWLASGPSHAQTAGAEQARADAAARD